MTTFEAYIEWRAEMKATGWSASEYPEFLFEPVTTQMWHGRERVEPMGAGAFDVVPPIVNRRVRRSVQRVRGRARSRTKRPRGLARRGSRRGSSRRSSSDDPGGDGEPDLVPEVGAVGLGAGARP